MERKEVDAKEGDLALRVVVGEPPVGASEPAGTDLVLDQVVELLLSVGLAADDAAEPGAMAHPLGAAVPDEVRPTQIDDPSSGAAGPGQEAVPKHAADTPGAAEREKALVVATGKSDDGAAGAPEPPQSAGTPGGTEPKNALVVDLPKSEDRQAEEGRRGAA